MEIKKVGVYGAGVMGRGIAQVFAQAGLQTQVFSLFAQELEAAEAGINKSLSKLVEKEKIALVKLKMADGWDAVIASNTLQ